VYDALHKPLKLVTFPLYAYAYTNETPLSSS